MPRITPALALTVLLGLGGLGLVGCSAPASETAPSASDAAPAASDAPETSDDTDAPTAADAAEELCASASGSGDDQVCVLENATASGDLSFSTFRVVKIIGGTFDGAIEVRGAEQVTFIESTVAADLTVDVRGGAVVKLSEIGGTLNVAGGHSATLVKNTVGGDLLCADGVQANGDGNSVAGQLTGTCSRVV